ncbi:MAG: biotin-dependent carboxyltransferase family protein [Gemmataceae bacterium]|nr:biotin-dependent carboxyltransferase family protein [Gemmataceae bacterium]
MTLRVLETGLHTLLVDFGRPGARSLGVPVGGAADRMSMALGNALVGNSPDAVALEITLAGPTLQAAADLAVVLYGAPFDLWVGDRAVQPSTTFTLQAHEVLRIGGVSAERGSGLRGYLCVRGGFQAPRVLGSCSALEPVVRGMELICSPGVIGSRYLPGRWLTEAPLDDTSLCVLVGAQADWFELGDLLDQTFSVRPQSNRMGLRLQGNALRLPQREMVSEPVCPGAVQVTRDGQCIILGVDGQTIGGYPKIAQVMSADLDRLGQLRPGDPVRFTPIGLEDAEAAYREARADLDRWLLRLRTAEVFVRGNSAAKTTQSP